ncbi:hypothetical protein LDB30_00730 [Acidithiobacillus ferrooxidans]|nr:hypothetical protein LDB30_00730 [Acidithiobacillus ferrooxidans]
MLAVAALIDLLEFPAEQKEPRALREMVLTEADTCREFVTPRLVEAGWGSAPYAIGEQRSFTNGRIIVSGGKVRRAKQKRADYLSHYRRHYPLAVVEAKNQFISKVGRGKRFES